MSPLNSGGGTFQLFIEIFIPLYLYRSLYAVERMRSSGRVDRRGEKRRQRACVRERERERGGGEQHGERRR